MAPCCPSVFVSGGRHVQALFTGALPHGPAWLACAVGGQGRDVACDLPGPSVVLARPPSIQH